MGVVDLISGVMTTTIGLENSPAGMHLDATGRMLYVSTGTFSVSIGPGPAFSIGMDGEVSVIDTQAQKVSFVYDTGLPPSMICFDSKDRVGLIPTPPGDGLSAIYPKVVNPLER